MMMQIFKFLSYFIFVYSIYGQPDTSEIRLNYSPGFTLRIDSLNRLNYMQTFNSFLQDTSLLWIRTRMQLNGFSSGEDHQKINFQTFILNPLQQQYMSSQSMSVWNYMLGMIQTGAFGYLAYEHLKKYGFLKKN